MRRPEDRFPMRRDRGGLSPWRESDFQGPSSFFEASPWQSMRRMQEDMDRLFGLFFGGQGGQGGQAGALAQSGAGTGSQAQAALQWAPSVDISESDREWVIEAELPGVSRDDIDLQAQQGYLILSAETRQEQETPGGRGTQQAGATSQGGQTGQSAQGRQYHRRERRYGYFQRVIPLPENVNEDQITCEFRNGVLTVHVPKTERARPQSRRIPIQDVDRLPSETASGRLRSEAEIEMTEDEDAAAQDRALAGAKGGQTSGSRRSAASAQTTGNAAAREGGTTGSRSRGGSQSGRSKKSGS